ncbi:NUDIX domain-containing protein [Chelativorans sp. ZYF759]|uniref:NUDIX hydrolase n=1 Tax=Chelativorans sp. ZYF759 TaxID=2692213 RepID=UPI00145DE28E|nr:NUDIX hydrolase [Chelativorans sp. ZYF759]NMG39922.1 NUDIX domain-containing protein [Chelativorans sp. ZYF759]
MLWSQGKRILLSERLRSLFGSPPPRLQVAALPWRLGKKGAFEIMLVTSRETRRWVLPKGWPEGMESLSEAAAREAHEEAGISGRITTTELGSYYYGKRLTTGLERRCQVLVFPLEVKKTADKWPEKKRRTRQWFEPTEAANLVNEPDLAELIVEFGQNPKKSAA